MRYPGLAIAGLFLMAATGAAGDASVPVGVAKIDVTPSYAVRLSGYGSRRAESEGVAQHIWAKALAIGADGEVVVVITVDNLGVPETICAEVAKRLKIPRERLAVCSSHTHSAPMLSNTCPTLFGVPIPPEHQKNIDRYTKELTDALTKVAANALADRRPGRLEWAKGTVGFAANRRTRGGVVDHDLPVLKVVREGVIIAIWVNYACHCTTLGGEFNKLHGDWAGTAQEFIERSYPGVTALVSIGCGADANPNPRGNVTIAEEHGQAIVRELTRLFTGKWTPLPGNVRVRFEKIDLPFDKIPTREQWEALAKRTDAIGYHAQYQLKKLDRGETIPDKIAYPVQTWVFGDKLAMVFLAGEVVVDYALRLKKEYAADRIWVNGYSNDATCYIPSQRILREGGYEGGGAMIYYDRPTKFAPAVEDVIFAALRKQIPPGFKAPKDPKEFPPPKSPEDSRKAIQVKPGFRVDLVASEPQISSPVAIDWGTDGRLWVVEMYDYPTGVDGNYKPGGRVKYLEDTKGTGQYDKVTVLADDIPFPTGIMAWRGGAIVCAAPDILYMEDTKRDGKCDVRKVLFTGFATENYQARVNGLTMGLDGWVYGANGLLGGKIKSTLKPGLEVNLGGRDFRMKPDTGEFEPASGLTQQGRARDDWGNWFGGDNSNLLRHYPLHEHYLRRNPHVAGPPPFVDVLRGGDADPNKLFPASHTLSRFNDLYMANRTTSACSPTIYRDNLLGQEYYGNAFICEPVHNLITRRVLEPRSTTFLGKRAADEQASEFLASTDNWFRPVQVRTGPDGALWVVDMYRFVIEHPRWIPPQRLAELDVRAGADRGRIYRVYPENSPPRSVPRLDKLERAELVKQLESPNGVVRDLVQRLIVERQDKECMRLLEKVVTTSSFPQGRMQATCTLDGLNAVDFQLIQQGLSDKNPRVVQHALRLAAPWMTEIDDKNRGSPAEVVQQKAFRQIKSPDHQVRMQVASLLGTQPNERNGYYIYQILLREGEDPYVVATALSSVRVENGGVMLWHAINDGKVAGKSIIVKMCAAAVPLYKDQPTRLLELLAAACSPMPEQETVTCKTLVGLAAVLDAMDQGRITINAVCAKADRFELEHFVDRINKCFQFARSTALNLQASEPDRLLAIRVLARGLDRQQEDIKTLADVLSHHNSPAIQVAALESLARFSDPNVPVLLLKEWASRTPAVRGRILDIFAARPDWAKTLLNAIEQKSVLPSELGLARTQRLLAHADASVRERATKVLNAAIDPNRQKLIDSYGTDAKRTGDAARGRAVYEKTCAACHKLGETGHAIGPDLAAVTDRSTDALLIAILDPNRALDARYSNYLATTKRGLQYSGMLQSETATSITLIGSEGKKQEILRTELEEFTNTGKSLMPDGVEKEISPAAMADLIAYLQSLGRPPKSVRGNKPKPVTASADGVIRLKASDCEIYGNEITFEAEFANLGMWHAEGDHAVWSLEVPKDGKYRVEMTYACDFGAAGNAFAVQVGAAAFTEKVVGTGRWSDYRGIKIGELDLKAGHTRLTFRPAGPVRGALLDLKEVRLVPVK